MNLTRIQEAFAEKIRGLKLGLPIVTPNALPNQKEHIAVIATETGRVPIQQNLEKWLGAVDCRISLNVSTDNAKINHYAEQITELFSVLDNDRSYLTTKNGIVLSVTDVRQFPLYISERTCSVNCRISFKTFLPTEK